MLSGFQIIKRTTVESLYTVHYYCIMHLKKSNIKLQISQQKPENLSEKYIMVLTRFEMKLIFNVIVFFFFTSSFQKVNRSFELIKSDVQIRWE